MKKTFLLLLSFLLSVACGNARQIGSIKESPPLDSHQEGECLQGHHKDPDTGTCMATATEPETTEDENNPPPSGSNHHDPIETLEEDILLRWTHHELSIDYNWDTCPANLRNTLRQAFQEAINMWNSVSGSQLKISVGDDLNVAPEEVYGVNNKGKVGLVPLSKPHVAVVICDNNFLERNASRPKIQGTRLASTFYSYSNHKNNGGYLHHAAIVLNTDGDGDTSLQNPESLGSSVLFVLAHEIGHAIGLQKHDPNGMSIMHASANVSTDLSPRDKRRVVARYPASSASLSMTQNQN